MAGVRYVITAERALAIRALDDDKIDAGIEHVLSERREMPLRCFVSNRVEARAEHEQLIGAHCWTPALKTSIQTDKVLWPFSNERHELLPCSI